MPCLALFFQTAPIPIALSRDWIWNRPSFPAYRVATMEKASHSAASANDDEQLHRAGGAGRPRPLSARSTIASPRRSIPSRSRCWPTRPRRRTSSRKFFFPSGTRPPAFAPIAARPSPGSVAQLRNRAIDRIRSRRRRGELLEANAPDLEPTGSAVASSARELRDQRARPRSPLRHGPAFRRAAPGPAPRLFRGPDPGRNRREAGGAARHDQGPRAPRHGPPAHHPEGLHE